MSTRLIAADVANGELTLSFLDESDPISDLVGFSCPIDINSDADTVCMDLERFVRRLRYLAAREQQDEQ